MALGVAFTAYGVALILYGSARGRAVDSALARRAYAAADSRISACLALAGVGLGLATGLLILLG